MKKVLKNFPIRLKMITSHGLIALMATFCATVALVGISGLIANLTTIHEDAMAAMYAAGELKFAAADIERSILGVILEDSTEHYAMLEAALDEDVEAFHQAFASLPTHLDAFCSSDGAKQLYQQLSDMFEESESVRIQIASYLERGDFSNAQKLYLQEYRVYLSRMIGLSEELKLEIDKAAGEYCTRVLRVNNIGIVVIIILVIISLILGTYLTHVVSDSVRLPVRQLMEVSEQMKQGNLSAAKNITYESNDELGKLAASMRETLLFLHSYVEEISHSLHKMANGDLTARAESISMFRGDFSSIRESLIYILGNLNHTLSGIDLAAEQVNAGALQISSGAQELAQGAQEQASSVEELSSAVADISQQINTTAKHAATAMNTSRETSEQAQVCNTQMQHMMEAMADLTEKATKISKIVKTIEDIAFQTNILALNAAVEAARAGTAGKGFAVVADEVRSLAAKSAEASQNTSELIGATVDAVNNSRAVLQETAESLTAVVRDSQSASELSGEIAQAATAQAAAVSQISQNIQEISTVVNSTSSTSEENAATSEELSGQAATLREMLERFRLRK